MSNPDNNEDTTVGDLLKMCKSYDAGVMTVIPRDAEGKVLGAVIVCNESSADEILDAVEQIQDSWDEEENDASSIPESTSVDDKWDGPVPVRIMLKGKGGDIELGSMEIAGMDASIIFEAHDKLELTFTRDQMKVLSAIFHEHLHGED